MKNKYSVNTFISLGLVLLALSFTATAGLFDKKISTIFGSKISTKISYDVLDADLNPYPKLTHAQSRALLALEARILGKSKKKIAKALEVEIVGLEKNEFASIAKGLTVFRVIITDAGQAGSELSGFLEFQDRTHRLLLFAFTLGEISAGDSVTVSNLGLVGPTVPQISVFVVPSALLNSNLANNYKLLYKTAEQRSLTSYGSTPSGKQTYTVLAFFNTVLNPNIEVNLKISDQPGGMSGSNENSLNRYPQKGWLVIANEFEIDLSTTKKWVKIYLKNNEKHAEQLTDETLIIEQKIGG